MADQKLDVLTAWVERNRTWLLPTVVATTGASLALAAQSASKEPKEAPPPPTTKDVAKDVAGRATLLVIGTGAVLGTFLYLNRPKKA